jgi:hypothetical protein
MVLRRMGSMLVVLAGSCAFAQSPDDSAALAGRFVRAMELHEHLAQGLRMSADKLRSEGKINDVQSDCLKQTKSAEFQPVMEKIANAQLTAAEMQEAIRFFESSAGKKYLQMSVVKNAEMVGVKSAAEMPDFTREEYDAANEFGTTKLYQKLVNESLMSRSAVARPLLQATTMEIIQRCMRR